MKGLRSQKDLEMLYTLSRLKLHKLLNYILFIYVCSSQTNTGKKYPVAWQAGL